MVDLEYQDELKTSRFFFSRLMNQDSKSDVKDKFQDF